MKKTTLYIVITLVMALASCTRNHGDIGIWFGTWHVERITASDTTVNVGGDYFFQFQNKVFRVSLVGDREQVVESYGVWEECENGNKMTISFPDTNVYYITMPGLEPYNDFTVTTTSTKEITFTKTDTTGILYVYHLKKQP